MSTRQNRALRHPSLQPISTEHPGALGYGGDPYWALGSIALAKAYPYTWGPPPSVWSAHYSSTGILPKSKKCSEI